MASGPAATSAVASSLTPGGMAWDSTVSLLDIASGKRLDTDTMDESRRWIEFGHYLIEQRERLGLKRREAAKRAQISENAWRELEIGQKESFGGIKLLPNPTTDVLKRIAEALEVPFEELVEHVGWRPAGSRSAAEDPESLSKANAALVTKISRLEPRDRMLVERLVDLMLGHP